MPGCSLSSWLTFQLEWKGKYHLVDPVKQFLLAEPAKDFESEYIFSIILVFLTSHNFLFSDYLK